MAGSPKRRARKAAEKKAIARARITPTKKALAEAQAEFNPLFVELLCKCRAEVEEPTDRSTKVQWAQLQLRVLVEAKADLRARMSTGQRPINYTTEVVKSSDPRPKP